MSTPTYQTVPVSCPNCQSRFVAPVLSIVDAGLNPQAKALFLSGQVNIAACPQCGYAGMLSSPIVYHDPDKELLLTFVPPELGLPEAEQQRIVGDLTKRVMSALPPEKRKGYLLRPRSFLRLEGMIEAILEADGITREMIEAQRAKAALLQRLLQATEEARETIARENDGQIDYQFFQLLSLNIQLAQREGRTEEAQQLLSLRQQLLGWTAVGKEVGDREEAIKSLGGGVTREGLLDKVVEAALAGEQTKVETLVAVARPAIDYIFYQQLTARIEAEEKAGHSAQAKTLKELRQTILDLTAEIDAEIQEATEEAAQFLQTVLDSDDPELALLDNLELVDELFFRVLASRLESAARAGRTEDVEKLKQIGDLLARLTLEGQPPEIQLINQLLAADYPDGTQALLEENREQVDARFLEAMRLVGRALSENGQEATATRLTQITEQAAGLIELA